MEMGEIHPLEPMRLLIGVLCSGPKSLKDYMKTINDFGEPEIVSPVMPFDFTDYYAPTMGAGLNRCFYLYPPPFDPADLADIKLRTNALEQAAARTLDLNVERPVNLDPGYLTPSKLVLASTKDHAHRIYLRDGIYAEITLHYRNKSFRPWPWTFPDFRSDGYIAFFNKVRGELFRS
jgi:hypothetical protein